MSRDQLRATHIGETRRKVRRIVMRMEATVTVEWPEGVPFDVENCKSIATCAMSQKWEQDVESRGGHGVVWATAYSECMEEDVEIIEDTPIDPPTYHP